MTPKRILLLSGSPKGTGSTSYAFLKYLQTRLTENEIESEIVILHHLLRKPEELEKFLSSINEVDYLILAAPLYIDTLPAHVLEVMSQIANYRKAGPCKKNPKFIGIVNSGFPEAHQNNLALDILNRFVSEADFVWMGGIPYGGGAMIGGTPLNESGRRSRYARITMDYLAKSLIAGKGVPEEAIKNASKMIIPTWVFFRFSKFGWKRRAKAYAAQDSLDAQPYLRAS